MPMASSTSILYRESVDVDAYESATWTVLDFFAEWAKAFPVEVYDVTTFIFLPPFRIIQHRTEFVAVAFRFGPCDPL